MVEAYILIQTEAGKASDVAREVSTMTGVTMCEYVMGPYEVIARVEAASGDELGKLVIARIQSVPGITRTTSPAVVLTCTVSPSLFRSSACEAESTSILPATA